MVTLPFVHRFSRLLPLALGQLAVLTCGHVAGQEIVLRGGEAQVRVLAGPQNEGFSKPFTAADFSAARRGPSASVGNRRPDAWYHQLRADSRAKWLSIEPTYDRTGLYAVDFTVDKACIGTAKLSLTFSVDNQLGDERNGAVFLNGKAVPGIGTNLGDHRNEYTVSSDQIAELLVRGTNTLFMNAVNRGSEAGLLFSATLEIRGSSALQIVGLPSPHCKGKPGLTTQGCPFAGNMTFAFQISGAPHFTPGLLLFAGASDPSGHSIVNGARLFVDLYRPVPGIILFIASDHAGNATIPMPLPAASKGLKTAVQTAWFNYPFCASGPQLSSSAALELTVD